MSILLLILKIIGILLLILLGLVLAVLLYLILLPVWLHAEGGYVKEPFLHAKVLGFLSFWQVDLDIRGKARDLIVSALWGKLRIYPRPARQKPEASAPEQKDESTPAAPEKPAESAPAAPAKEEPAPAKPAESAPAAPAKEEPAPAKSAEEAPAPEDGHLLSEGKADEDKKTDLSGVFEMIADPANRRAVGTILRWLFYIPKKMRFHMGGTKMRFALSDPQATGMLSALLLQLPVWYEEDVRLDPDFTSEDPYMDGVVCVNAHLSVAMILYAVLRILMDRDCRGLIKAVLKLMK